MAGLVRILLATDFGASASVATSDAALLSRLYGAPVDVVHVHPAVPRSATSIARRDQLTERRLSECRQALVEHGARAGETRVSEGSAAEALLHAAEALDSTLIVLGAGNRGGPDPLTGATAETVARFARQAVWLARPRGQPGLARALIAVDRSPASREALSFGLDLCDRSVATPTIAHVLEHADWEPGRDTSAGVLAAHQARADDELQAFLRSASPADTAGLVRLEWGAPTDVLRRLAREEKSDVVIVGRTGLGGLRRVFLGGTAERLLRSLPSSLLLTSPAGPA
jgi:nucleotide-binding universal stress UspA family protein